VERRSDTDNERAITTKEEVMAKRTITNNRSRPAKYVPLQAPRSKPVAGTASSQNRRPVGDVRGDARFVKAGAGRPSTLTVGKRRTT
jgi:hypothetical protein